MLRKIWIKISYFNIVGLNIFIGQTGDLNVSIKFENPDALNKFEENYISIIADLKQSLVFKENILSEYVLIRMKKRQQVLNRKYFWGF